MDMDTVETSTTRQPQEWGRFKLSVIHTTPVTVGPLRDLAQQLMPGLRVINLVDDSILPELAENGGDVGAIAGRWRQYAHIAERQGADCILNACSSIGELCAAVRPEIAVPIVRIDEAMAEHAVRSAGTIGVAATLATTLGPTQRLLQQLAERLGREVRLVPEVISSAYERLLAGDRQGHDEVLAETLARMAGTADIVVLAQASMARAVEGLPPEERSRFLTSPAFGMGRVREQLSANRMN
ncbi:aspartate/glutamate racemase family protein [Paenibacillus sp. PSB04]|uniref:aspartate/glutamate racemase family protein n=1 Tax=Paenibacillus sp. PSB04 TaxID=2866810 RepID=UPI0021F0C56C|nr:aspartate/glutamate racemase family protein [Paenibacillus sp. PSB04]UYO06625.1 aspartate/glutamate racemase family protein [Paenibacillus sp. PSB04]